MRNGSDVEEAPLATGLLDHDIDLVAVLHLEAVRSVPVLQSLPVEDEPALVRSEALSLAVGIHEFLELGGPLNLEKDLRAILRLDLDIDVLLLALGSGAILSSSWLRIVC